LVETVVHTAITREYKQAEVASQRSGALPSVEAHEAKMTAMRQARLGGMKANSELEQQVYHLQGELERLQQELKDEESEAVDALELDSEVCVALLSLSLALEVHHRRQQVLTTHTHSSAGCASSCTATWASSRSRRTASSPRWSSVRPSFSRPSRSTDRPSPRADSHILSISMHAGSQNSRDARTVQLDKATSDYQWSERLWDLASQ